MFHVKHSIVITLIGFNVSRETIETTEPLKWLRRGIL